MGLLDTLKSELDKAGKAAHDALDEGKLRLEAHRAKLSAEAAAASLGFAVYRAKAAGADLEPERYSVLPRFQRPDKSDPFEQEANCFAANLLVPKRLLAPVKHASPAQLASIFAVSREMMENRLKNV